jgi:hypothetical protein
VENEPKTYEENRYLGRDLNPGPEPYLMKIKSGAFITETKIFED